MTRTELAIAKIAMEKGLLYGPRTVKIQRTYAGRNQRGEGGWIWWLHVDYHTICGSCWPAHECIKAHKEGRLVAWRPRNQDWDLGVEATPELAKQAQERWYPGDEVR